MNSYLSSRDLKLAALALVLIHLVVSIVHGRAHQGAMVDLTLFGYVYVVAVITVAPLVAAALLFSRWRHTGALLLTVSMAGSFAFGVWHHFLAAGTDNVAEVRGAWRSTFLWTALALAALELLGFISGLLVYRVPGKTTISG